MKRLLLPAVLVVAVESIITVISFFPGIAVLSFFQLPIKVVILFFLGLYAGKRTQLQLPMIGLCGGAIAFLSTAISTGIFWMAFPFLKDGAHISASGIIVNTITETSMLGIPWAIGGIILMVIGAKIAKRDSQGN